PRVVELRDVASAAKRLRRAGWQVDGLTRWRAVGSFYFDDVASSANPAGAKRRKPVSHVVFAWARCVVDTERIFAAGEGDFAERHSHSPRTVDEHPRRMRKGISVVADVGRVRRNGKWRRLRGNGHLVLDFSTTRKVPSLRSGQGTRAERIES